MVCLVFILDFGTCLSLGLSSLAGTLPQSPSPSSPHTLPTLTHIGALNRWQAQQDYLGPLPRKATGTRVRVHENRLSMCLQTPSVTALWMPLKEMRSLVSRWFSSSDCQQRFKEDMEDFRISDF